MIGRRLGKVDRLLLKGKVPEAIEELTKQKHQTDVKNHARKCELELRRADALARSGKRLKSRVAAFKAFMHHLEDTRESGWKRSRRGLWILVAGVLLGNIKYRQSDSK